jgi:ligand-binding sensor domain-containing protein/serine phosphatase RsbU (regulator of sigma subunit)
MQKAKLTIKNIIFILLSLTLGGNTYSQSYYFDNYSVREGLAQSTVYDILQDSSGYVWLGTSAGVSRFDGIKFNNYSYRNGLGKNAVQKVIEDKYGNLWFGHKGGAISRLKNDTIQTFYLDTTQVDITTLHEDKEGNIWAGTFGIGCFKIKNPNTQLLKNIDFIQYKEKLNKYVFKVFEKRDGTLFFIVHGGIKYFDEKVGEFKYYRPENLPQFYQFTCMFEDSKGNLWFGTDIGGLYKSNKDGSYTSYMVKDGLASNFISTISEDKSGKIWLGTWGEGINTISGDKIETYNKINGLPDSKIRCIVNDLEGNVLIGTNENGLCIFKGSGFINYHQKDGINGEHVNAILQDKNGAFWFGTDSGLTVFNQQPGVSEKTKYYNTSNNKIPEDRIHFIKEDNNGTIWIAGENTVVSNTPGTEEFIYNLYINGYIRHNNVITSMVIDKHNSIWIGTIEGLFVYDIDLDAISQFSKESGLASDNISALFCDSKNRVWIGCEQMGLTVFDPVDTLFINIKEPTGFTPISITESFDNKIWVGTQSQGILVFDNYALHQHFTYEKELLSNNITDLHSAINDNIYIGTSRGLNKYNPKEQRFSSYSGKTGFTGIEVKKSSGFIDKDGNVWLGTVKGATKIILAQNQDNLLEPRTHINKLRVNQKEVKLQNNITLSYLENSIIFDYTSICLSDPDAVEYKTMLEGAEKEWQPVTKQTTASYTGLPHGEYTFKVKAKNSAGIWNEKPVTFSFRIKPPFWKAAWFWVIVSIIVVSAIFAYIKVREQKLVKEKLVLEEKVRERTIEISDKNKKLEAFNKNITGSIKYAKRIQDAMLPNDEHLNSILPEHFILYKPRDIVSGDYYWATKKEDHLIVAAVDCTGHGVPGAFMSMLGITLLDEIINKKNITDTAEILNQMRQAVITSLKQRGIRGETQDGMDVAIVSINTATLEAQFSGAYNPLYLIRKDKLIRYKGNRMPIGIYYKKTGDFSSKTIQFEKDDRIYLFTDGYIDQFNEYSGEKLMTKNFRKYLLKSQHLSMENQSKYLEEKLADWQGKIDQVDDILVMGLKIDFNNRQTDQQHNTT